MGQHLCLSVLGHDMRCALTCFQGGKGSNFYIAHLPRKLRTPQIIKGCLAQNVSPTLWLNAPRVLRQFKLKPQIPH